MAKQRWKALLLVVAILIGFASLYITNSLVQDLSHEERKKIESPVQQFHLELKF